jgi:hypothetical protein
VTEDDWSPQLDNERSPMLPDLPYFKQQIRRQIELRIHQESRARSPLLAGIRTTVQHEGTTHAYDRIKAPPVTEGFQTIAVPVSIQFSEVPDLMGAWLNAKIDDIAENLAQQEMQMWYQKHSKGCEEVGTAVNASGAPLTGEQLLEMFEKVDMEFGSDNQPLGRFSVTPALAGRLQEIEKDPAFQVRYKELVERKRHAWRDRESNRKLVD